MNKTQDGDLPSIYPIRESSKIVGKIPGERDARGELAAAMPSPLVVSSVGDETPVVVGRVACFGALGGIVLLR